MREAPVHRAQLLERRASTALAALLALAGFGIAWVGQATDLDLRLADWVYDAGARAFPWRDAWLAATFNHVIVKGLCALAALAFIGTASVDLIKPSTRRSSLQRLRLRVVALSALLVPTTISLFKRASVSHCPWDLARYGGKQPYLRLFDALPAGIQAGHCLPAGHASSALWLVALALYWLPAPPRGPMHARSVALLMLALGGASGWLQQLRGAHFLTHTLWSMWIACAIVLALVVTLQWGATFSADDGAGWRLGWRSKR